MAQPLYSTINMNTMPGEMKLPGKTLKAQALSVNYQDLPRDMQIMRDQEYQQEVKQGEFVPEFGAWTKEFDAWTKEFDGLGDLTSLGIGTYLVIALLLGGGIFAYYKFFHQKPVASRKRKASRKRAR